jgi:hypothetical protein
MCATTRFTLIDGRLVSMDEAVHLAVLIRVGSQCLMVYLRDDPPTAEGSNSCPEDK